MANQKAGVQPQAQASDSKVDFASRIIGMACKSADEIETMERAALQRKIDARVDSFAKQAGGARIANYRFSNWSASTPAQAAILAAVSEWATTFRERKAATEGLVLYGPCGTGKDHLAFAAVRQAMIETGATAAWANGRDLMGEVRDRISADRPERELIHRYEAPDVLVISDPLPPMGELKDFQADVLYRIIENRYADARLTVMTLNVGNDAEADRRLGAPTWDRICDRAWKCFCNWPSHRKPARIVGVKQ